MGLNSTCNGPDHGRIETRHMRFSSTLNDYLTFPYVGQAFEIKRLIQHERIDGLATPEPQRTGEIVIAALENCAHWTDLTVDFWQDAMDMFRRYPNEFCGWRELTGDSVNATPGGDPENCFWQIPEGKALIMRVQPVECLFWNIEFNNPWWETQDYRFHLSGTNNHHAVRENDGELIVVAAHEDPALPNWLDTCGYTQGMMGRRWMFAKSNPRYECTLVDHGALLSHLPKSVKRLSAEGRRQQIAARQTGLYRRFGTL